MKKVLLKNSFHSSQMVITIPDEWSAEEAFEQIQFQALGNSANAKKAKAKLRKIKKTLCGMDDCQCGVVRRVQLIVK